MSLSISFKVNKKRRSWDIKSKENILKLIHPSENNLVDISQKMGLQPSQLRKCKKKSTHNWKDIDIKKKTISPILTLNFQSMTCYLWI